MRSQAVHADVTKHLKMLMQRWPGTKLNEDSNSIDDIYIYLLKRYMYWLLIERTYYWNTYWISNYWIYLLNVLIEITDWIYFLNVFIEYPNILLTAIAVWRFRRFNLFLYILIMQYTYWIAEYISWIYMNLLLEFTSWTYLLTILTEYTVFKYTLVLIYSLCIHSLQIYCLWRYTHFEYTLYICIYTLIEYIFFEYTLFEFWIYTLSIYSLWIYTLRISWN